MREVCLRGSQVSHQAESASNGQRLARDGLVNATSGFNGAGAPARAPKAAGTTGKGPPHSVSVPPGRRHQPVRHPAATNSSPNPRVPAATRLPV